MTWIIKESAAGTRYLWDYTNHSSTHYGAIGTVGGGYFDRTTCAPWWVDGQEGARRFTQRDEAHRIAKKLNGRVVKLAARGNSDGKGGT